MEITTENQSTELLMMVSVSQLHKTGNWSNWRTLTLQMEKPWAGPEPTRALLRAPVVLSPLQKVNFENEAALIV